MYSLYLDPYLLAAPVDATNLNEFDKYINSLLMWREILQDDWLSLYSLANIFQVLIDTDSYPVRQHLDQAISKLGIFDVQTRDIVELVNAILYKLPSIDDVIDLSEMVFDNGIVEPDYNLSKRPEAFVKQYIRLLITVCIANTVRKMPDKFSLLITEGLINDVEILEVKGDIICEFKKHPDQAIPDNVHSRLRACNSPHGLYLALDPVILWSDANNENCFHKALACQAYQHLGNSTKTKLGQWRFRAEFFESARKFGFLHDPLKIKMLLRACSETILNSNMNDTHALRNGTSGEAPQIKRDNDGAWRRDIDHEFHLHYWQTGDGPEFALVVVHNDFSIPR